MVKRLPLPHSSRIQCCNNFDVVTCILFLFTNLLQLKSAVHRPIFFVNYDNKTEFSLSLQMTCSSFALGAEMAFNGSSAHRWAVCTCAQLVGAAMESRDAVGVISPSETCNRTSRDVIRESRGEGRVMEEKKLRTRYSAPCFLKEYPSFRTHCARSSQQYPRTLFCRVKGPLETLPLFLL